MSLDASISTSVDRIDEVLNLIVGHLNGARGPSVPEFALLELTSAKTRLAAIRAECNAIRAWMAAGRATGQVEKPVSVEELELHPVNLDAGRATPYFDHMMAAAGEKPEDGGVGA